MPFANEIRDALVHVKHDKTPAERDRGITWRDHWNQSSFVFRPFPFLHARKILFQAKDTRLRCQCHLAHTHAPSSKSFAHLPTFRRDNQIAKRSQLRYRIYATT